MPDDSSQRSIDFNILPAQYRPRVVPPIIRIIWVIAVVLLIAALPALVFMFGQQGAVSDLERERAQVESTLRVVRTPEEALATLQEELSHTVRLLEQIETIYPIIEAERRNWPQVLSALADYDPERLRVVELFQRDRDLTLVGLALSRDDVLSYQGSLERSGAFLQVSLQGMEVSDAPFAEPTPTATPTITGTVGATPTVGPGTPVATPMPPPYDAYEMDDLTPGYIAIGETQTRNFYPQWDVDTVEFLGKAGRRYCVMALPQALGVDPVLEVKVGTSKLENDDCVYSSSPHIACLCPSGGPADSLAAKVEVQVPRTGDETVLVRINNRARFGPEQTYTLQVIEVIGDAWEVDDVIAKPIGINEVQERSFFPAGDIDRVTFVAKPNVVYRLSTDNLAPGVDTVISAQVGDKTYRNDDAVPGEVRSEVTFSTPVDQRVYVNVTNKGLFGANATYSLSLTVVGGDIYEPDDNNPKPISPFEEQERSFYPEGDIDRMTLNVKAGVEYTIQTYDLAPGVDTVIKVEFDGQVFWSDDIQRDNIASEVRFTAWKDGVALITITNREQYGIDMTYKVIVLPTGPGPTLTPTTDLRDPYEPDQQDPPTLAVNDVQRRNFYPDGDVDYVRIPYKAGRTYQLRTYNLAPGVDTVLEMTVEGIVYRNEDIAVDDVSSRIVFTPLYDGETIATVRNRGRYGPNQTYDITLTLLPPAPTATPTATPTLDLRDAYEPDEVTPQYLLPGQIQRRNFFPSGDIDYARLDLQAGWVYFVRAAGLAPGVEPLLSATVDGALQRGYPDSLRVAELRLEPQVNQDVLLEIRNFAGIYGGDKEYELTITRLAPTPTPSGGGALLARTPSAALAQRESLSLSYPALARAFTQAEGGNPIRFVFVLRMR
jgi:Tfp pilus assembly protein PilN